MEHRVQNFLPRGVHFGISSAFDVHSVFDVSLVVFFQPLSSSRPIWNQVEDEWDTNDGYNALDELYIVSFQVLLRSIADYLRRAIGSLRGQHGRLSGRRRMQ
jgi:hypothetical protein